MKGSPPSFVFHQARPLSQILNPVLDPLRRKHLFLTAQLALAWPDIVGRDLAAKTRPKSFKLTHRAKNPSGTLILSVKPGFALEIQHALSQIRERVQAHLGGKSVQTIRLDAFWDPAEEKLPPPAATSPSRPSDPVPLPPSAASLEDGPLKTALARLGRGILQHRR